MKKIDTAAKQSLSTRRKFLGSAAAGTAGAALALPMIATAQAPTQLRFQSTWPSKDIFHEYAATSPRRSTT